MSIFNMGEYNFYVWSSVLVSFLVLFLTYFDAIKKHKHAMTLINKTNVRE